MTSNSTSRRLRRALALPDTALQLRQLHVPWADPFGTFKPIKRATVSLCAVGSFAHFFVANRLRVEGQEVLDALPRSNVLFVMNHQTYFMDMIGFYWVVSSPNPFHHRPWIYFVADRKTMQKNVVTEKLFRFAGLVGVNRTWKEGDTRIKRAVDPKDQQAVGSALDDGWVVTFPQGTTQPFAPVRRGSARIIQTYRPLVVPVVIDGFGEAFPKGGLWPRKRGVDLSVRVKPPLELDYDVPVDELTATIAEAIEQSPRSASRG